MILHVIPHTNTLAINSYIHVILLPSISFSPFYHCSHMFATTVADINGVPP